jgi:hypothetical protein
MARLLIAEPVDPGLGLVSLFERPHAIVTRLNYLDKPPGRQTMRKIITAIVVVTMFFCVLPMSFTQADSKAKDVKINGHMPNNAMKLSTVSEQAKTSAPVEMLAQVQKNVSPKTESTIGDNTTDDSNKTSGLFQPKAGNSGMISQNKDEEIDRPITFELHLFTSSLDALKEALKQNGINNNNIKGHLYGMKPIGNAANSLVQIDGIEPDNRPDLSLIFSMRDQESADLIRILTTDSNFREIDRQIAPGLSGKPIELSISGNQTGAFDMLRIKAIVHLLGNDK